MKTQQQTEQTWSPGASSKANNIITHLIDMINLRLQQQPATDAVTRAVTRSTSELCAMCQRCTASVRHSNTNIYTLRHLPKENSVSPVQDQYTLQCLETICEDLMSADGERICSLYRRRDLSGDKFERTNLVGVMLLQGEHRAFSPRVLQRSIKMLSYSLKF